jgi:hypothetical protein
MFSISLAKTSEANLGKGIIQLANHVEGFESFLGYWSIERYVEHWRDQVSKFLKGAQNACLLTSISEPDSANFFRCWAIYNSEKITGEVIFQEHLLFLDELHEPFNEWCPEKSVSARETKTEDGFAISEWAIDQSQLLAWLGTHGED